VADQPEVLRRVRLSRMSVDYAIVERARAAAGQGKLSADSVLGRLAARRFEPFMQALAGSQVTRLMEWRPLDKQEYHRGLAEALRPVLE